MKERDVTKVSSNRSVFGIDRSVDYVFSLKDDKSHKKMRAIPICSHIDEKCSNGNQFDIHASVATIHYEKVSKYSFCLFCSKKD